MKDDDHENTEEYKEKIDETNDDDCPVEDSQNKQKKLQTEKQRSNILARKLKTKSFNTIWEYYTLKEDIDRISKSDIAAHFFYLGAKSAFEEKTKDYDSIKKDKESEKIERMRNEKKIRDLKKNIFKIGKDGLDIDKTIKKLRRYLDETEETTIRDYIEKEIAFLEEYRKKRNKARD